MNSLYGNYRQKTFAEVWPEYMDFWDDYTDLPEAMKYRTGNDPALNAGSAQCLYYMLYAKYGNSVIASSDLTQFKFKVFTLIWQHHATWRAKVDTMYSMRNLTLDEIKAGTTQIYNHSYNPSTAPGTSTLDELTTINEQTATKNKRGTADALVQKYQLILEDTATEKFLAKFKNLFLKIVEPEVPLWYVTDLEVEEGEDE